MILLINGLFAQSLHCAQQIILGISSICLRSSASPRRAQSNRRTVIFFACLDLERKSS
jgi:hypothetical protein